MATQSSPLRATARVTCDGSGNGVTTFGPHGAWESWIVSRLSISTESAATLPGAIARLWRGPVGGQLIDGTYTPWQDISETNFRVERGETLYLEAEACGAGETVTLLVEGTANFGGI